MYFKQRRLIYNNCQCCAGQTKLDPGSDVPVGRRLESLIVLQIVNGALLHEASGSPGHPAPSDLELLLPLFLNLYLFFCV